MKTPILIMTLFAAIIIAGCKKNKGSSRCFNSTAITNPAICNFQNGTRTFHGYQSYYQIGHSGNPNLPQNGPLPDADFQITLDNDKITVASQTFSYSYEDTAAKTMYFTDNSYFRSGLTYNYVSNAVLFSTITEGYYGTVTSYSTP